MKKIEIQDLNVELRKITDQKFAETFNEYFVVIAENVKTQITNNPINIDNSIDNHTHFTEQAFNKPHPKCGT